MVDELIPIQPRYNGKQTVNARDLWEFLESKQDFSTWINNRIASYGFVENEDFITFHKKMERKNGVRGASTLTEYHISLDMAKELSMVERNEKGRQARKYFIQCEKKLHQVAALPQTFPEALRALAAAEEEKLLIAAERDEAERTKAMIGSKREASAMGKASAETRKRKKLENEIGRGEEYCTAVSILWLGEYFNLTNVAYQQIGKQLTKISKELKQDCPLTSDPALSRQVKRYHRSVIAAFRCKIDTVWSVLEKYRKQA